MGAHQLVDKRGAVALEAVPVQKYATKRLLLSLLVQAPEEEVGAPACHLRAACELPSVHGEAAPQAEEEAEMVSITATAPPVVLGPLRVYSDGRQVRPRPQDDIDAEELATEFEHVSLAVKIRPRRQRRDAARGSGHNRGRPQRRGAAFVIVQQAHVPPHRVGVHFLPAGLAGPQLDGRKEMILPVLESVEHDGAVARDDGAAGASPLVAPGLALRHRRQRGGVVHVERVDERGRSALVGDGEDAAAGGVGSLYRRAADGGEGQEVPSPTRREGRAEQHVGVVDRRVVILENPREEARRAGRRQSLVPRPARGAEADEVAGVVQAGSDLAEHVGGELGPWRRGDSSRVVVHQCTCVS